METKVQLFLGLASFTKRNYFEISYVLQVSVAHSSLLVSDIPFIDIPPISKCHQHRAYTYRYATNCLCIHLLMGICVQPSVWIYTFISLGLILGVEW